MATIAASMVARLRSKTDAPMMECKKALIESDGDIGLAEDLLRVRLGTKACKVSSRLATEGIIVSRVCSGVGTLLELNCETDFVASNKDFLEFGKAVVELVSRYDPSDLKELSEISMQSGTVESNRAALIGKIGENIIIRRFKRIKTNKKLATYVHDKRIGVLVEFDGEDTQIGKDIAMHIAAMQPISISLEDISPEVIIHERNIAKKKVEASGKSPEIIEKIIEGSLQKYLKNVSLLNQPFVRNDKQTVCQFLKAANSTVLSFVLYVLGEEIEKFSNNAPFNSDASKHE